MNRSAWISALMKSNVPQNLMKTFGYRRKRNRSMSYSLMGVAVSAAAAYLFRNRMGGMRQLFQNSNMDSGFNRPVSPALTEFAKELTGGMKNEASTNNGTGYHSASSTNPETSQIISQIASTVKETGNDEQLDQLANKLIQKNV